jgi:hypothetical protein
MASLQDLSDRYLRFNQQSVKNISIVVAIEGADLISSRTLYTRVRYGDAGIFYGTPGIVYGGLRRVLGVRDILSFDGSSLNISQTIEPEQGRGSISQMTLAFVDKDQYMTQLIAPGVIIPDILGANVVVSLGFEEISYPEEFSTIFRGKVTSVQAAPGKVILGLSDPNVTRRQNVFFGAKSPLAGNISASQTTIPVLDNSDFHQQILGPDGTYDPGVQTWIKVDDEFMQYAAVGGKPNSTSFVVTRSALDPLGNAQDMVAHDAGAEVAAALFLMGNPLDLALKIMLSGWNGPYRTGLLLGSVCYTGDSSIGSPVNALVLPRGKSWTRDYGASEGDKLTVTGSAVAGNNKAAHILAFADLFDEPDRIAYMDDSFTVELSTTAQVAIRSQYDTLPLEAGVKLRGDDVDVGQHVFLRNTFLSSELMSFILLESEPAKSFIEAELYLPVAAYSLTKKGMLSVGLTTPPIADERIQILTADNILDPASIAPKRDTNNRKFYNRIDWSYDYNAQGNFTSLDYAPDLNSISIIGITSVLPISSRGSRTALGFKAAVDRRSRFLLGRYGRGATQIQVKVNYEVGSTIEAGDTVVLQDGGALQISDFVSGKRGLGAQLFEVLNRSLPLNQGYATLQLVAGLQTNLQDKYATWAPSSTVVAGSTTSAVVIQDSFGVLYPKDEKRKWKDFIGLRIVVHSYDFTSQAETRLLGFDPSNGYRMLVDPPLPFTPAAGYIVDLANYPDNTDPQDQAIAKLIHIFWDFTIAMAGAASGTQVTVAAGQGARFKPGQPVYAHKPDYSVAFSGQVLSDEAIIESVSGDVVTLKAPGLGYTPAAGDILELIGFPDNGAPYRWI